VRRRGRRSYLGFLALLVCVAPACSSPDSPDANDDAPRSTPAPTRVWASPDPRLLEAIEHYTGVAGRVDDERASELIFALAQEEAAPLARMWVARVYSRGRMGVERDTVRARALAEAVIDTIHALARSGEAEAIFLMGTAYDEGLGRPIDYGEAVRWYREAAGMEHVLAQHNLGNVYAAGRGIEQDWELAVRWWTPPAERGDAITQLRLGEAYEAGRGVEAVDTAVALTWYRRAAEAGNAQATEAVARLSGPGG